MKKFSLRTFLTSTCIIGILTSGSFFAAFSEAENPTGSGLLLSLSADTLQVFGFPIITLFSRLDIELGLPFFLLGLVTNCLLYGLLTERIISLIRQRTKIAVLTKESDH